MTGQPIGGRSSELMLTSKHSVPAPTPGNGTHPTLSHGAFRARCLRATKLPVCLCILLTLTACLPERQWQVPRITGTVKANGQPAGGVKVLITRTEGSCSEPLSVEVTDAQGGFSYQGLSGLRLGRVFTSPEQTYSICLQSGGSPVLGLSRRIYGPYKHAEVNCELQPNAAPTQKPLCTIKDTNP